MRRLGVSMGALLVGCAVAMAAGADEGATCASVMKGGGAPLENVIEACTFVVENPIDSGNKARALRYRGLAFQRAQNFPRARADLDQALQLTPDDALALKARAEVSLALGDRDGARADYLRLTQLEPKDTRWRIALNDLGAAPPPPPTSPPQQLVAREPPTAPATAPPTTTAAPPTPLFGTRPDIRQTEVPPPPPLPPPPPSAAAPAATVPATQPGPDTGALIRKLQTALRGLGYEIDAVTGRVGPQTRAAVDRFAAENGLPAGQEPDEAMLAAAERSWRDRQQQTAARQRTLNQRAQLALLDLRYPLGNADGVFGSQSRRALADWLRAQGRPARSEVDEALVAELEAAAVLTAAEAPPQPPPPREELAALAPATSPSRTTNPEPAPPPSAPPANLLSAPAPDPTIPSPSAPPTTGQPEQAVAAVEPARVPAVEPQRRSSAARLPAPDKRVALVIGNSAYQNVTPLRNPRQDAEDMAQALTDIGFEVIEGYDLNRDAMDDKTTEFARKAAVADLSLVYYSGHGLQFEGVNYLLPTDGRVEDRLDLRRLYRLDQLTEDATWARKAIVVVDACRNDADLTKRLAGGGTRAVGGSGAGLAQPGLLPPKTLIAYATRPGSVAYDGTGRNSPYVAALLRHIKTPDVDVQRMLGMVTDDVAHATGDAQVPNFFSSLGGDSVFLVATPPAPAGLALAELTAGERRTIQRSLKWLGYWDGPVDGAFSSGLDSIVRSFQRERGDEANGVLSPSDVLALYRRASLQKPPEPLPPVTLNDVLIRATTTDDPEAQQLMAMILDPAFTAVIGMNKDQAQALRLYERAARQGDRTAAARLGLILSAPGRQEQDRVVARKWLEQAAQAGEPAAALRLAELLLESPEAEKGRGRVVQLLTAATASPETDGLAAARLRDLGEPVVR